MIKKYNIYLLAISIGILSFSCNVNEPILIPGDIAYVAFSKSELAVRENKQSLSVELYLTALSTDYAEFTLKSSIEGISSPAIEGVDFNLPPQSKVVFENGMGYQTISLEIIDNNVKDGLKQFWLEIESGTPGYDIGIDGRNKVLISIQDDEHPLKFILGTYEIEAASYFGSQYNVLHDRLLIEPDADTTKVLINNVIEGVSPELSRPLVGKVDVVNMQIMVNSGQQWSNPKSNGYYFAFYKGNPGNANDQGPEPLIGETFTLAINKTDSGITITGFDNWGPKWMEPAGSFDSWWWWDFYVTSTLTKVEDY